MRKAIRRSLACLLLQSGLVTLDGQTNLPVQLLPSRLLTNNSPVYAKDKSIMPPPLVALPQSPLAATNFDAVLSVAGDAVPDTHGAVGTNMLMTILNKGVKLQTRGGALIYTNSLAGFWTSTNIGFFADVFDPRVTYDPFNDRWIAVAGTDSMSTNSSIVIGVSRTGNPTNAGDAAWNLRRIRADTTSQFWPDQPTLGFNKNWIVVQANMFPFSTNMVPRSHIFVFNKTNLYAGGSNAPTLLMNTGTNSSGNEVPAVTYDNSISTLYLLQDANGNTNGHGYLRLFSITGPIGSEVLNNVTNPLYICMTNTWSDKFDSTLWRCCFARQSNSSHQIGTVLDARLANVVYRNGNLWTAHTVFLPAGTNVSRSAVQWWQIKPSTNSADLLQHGRIDDPTGANVYGFGSIAVNKFDDVLIGYSSFSSNYYASASYSFRAYYEMGNQLEDPRIYKPGDDVFYDERWGDYSATTVDPLNDADFWTIQEYAATAVTNDLPTGLWGTRWAQVTVVLPKNDNFASAQMISAAQGTTNGTNVRATKEIGEPNHSGNAGGASVWYKWTAPYNGQVEMDTTGSDFNTLLAVYTGSSVSSLTMITNNNDFNGGQVSRVIFTATSNTIYRVAVDGDNDLTGNLRLSWCQTFSPLILDQPQGTNVVANANEDANFSVLSCGIPSPLVYQWRFQATNSGAATTNIPGATNSAYTVHNVQTNNAGYYSATVNNSSGSATSSVATLFVYGDSSARMSLWNYATGQFHFHIFGLTNRPYVIQTSTNLASSTNWYRIFTNTVSFWYTNRTASNDPQRFYRTITNN